LFDLRPVQVAAREAQLMSGDEGEELNGNSKEGRSRRESVGAITRMAKRVMG
jgi:hypothetical protein